MSRTKEISEDPRQRVVDAHQANKGYNRRRVWTQAVDCQADMDKWRTLSAIVTLPRATIVTPQK